MTSNAKTKRIFKAFQNRNEQTKKDRAGFAPAAIASGRLFWHSINPRAYAPRTITVYRPPILAHFIRVAWAMHLMRNTLSNVAAIRQRYFAKNCRLYFTLSRNPNQNARKNIFGKIGCIAPNRLDESAKLADTSCMTLTDSDANNEVTR